MAPELAAGFEKRFPGGAVIRADLRLPVETARVTVLFGPSGSGKTTVLRCLAGLEQPEHGAIRCGAETWFDAAAGVSLPPQGRRVGYLFQEYALFPHLSVRRNIEYGLPLRKAETRARAGELIGRFGLAGFEDRPPRALSGGQQQRVALARALAPAPRLLLLDEPLAALDVPTRARLRAELRRLLLESGVPSVVVTHDRQEALTLGDTMAVMVDGQIRQVGAVAEVFSRPVDHLVAESVGVETVVAAQVTDLREGLVEASVGGSRILAVDPGGLQKEGEVLVCIRAEDVLLETEPRRQESARNHFPALVQSLTPEGPLVRVALDCGFALAALVTRPACEELHLAPGRAVIAAVKASSIHLIPRA